MNHGALLTGLSLEPQEALVGQVEAWDSADVLQTGLTAAKKHGGKVLPGKVAGWIEDLGRQGERVLGSKEPDRFTSVEDWRLKKLCRLAGHINLRIEQEPSGPLLELLGARIEEKVVATLRAGDERNLWQRLRSAPRSNAFDGNTIEAAAAYMVRKVFFEIEDRFEALDERDQRRVAERILAEIECLDPVTRARIRERLDVDRLGVDALLKSGAIAGLGSSLGAAVVLGGFGSYTLLTSTLATVAGVFGVVLPFKFYILATSTLALVANPLTIGAVALGGGLLLRAGANRSIRERYFTLFAALAVVAGGAEGADKDEAVGRLVDHAKRRYREFAHAVVGERKIYDAAFPAFRLGGA
jgi:hypothetical protein